MMDAPTGGSFGVPPEPLTVELDASEAAFGTTKHVTVSGFQQVAVRIPPGIADGTVLRVPAASPGPAGGPAGDVLIRVLVRPVAGPYGPPTSFQPPYHQQSQHGQAYPPFQQGQQGQQGQPFPQGQQGQPFQPGGPVPAPANAGQGRKVALVAVGLAVVMVIGCCGVVRLLSGSDDTESTASPGSSTSGTGGKNPSPSRRTVPPEEYQQLLTGLDTALTPGFQKLATANSPKVVGETIASVRATVTTELTRLEAVSPQGPAQAAHTELVGALDDLSTTLTETGKAAGNNEVCAGSAALSKVTQAPGAARLRTVASTLSTADPAHPYKVGAFLPAAVPAAERRLTNGSFVKKAAKTGSGKLEIKNGGAGDAAITMVVNGTNSPFLTVYVRGNSNYTVGNVRDGDYRIFMASGKDWDAATKGFTRDCDYQKFDDEFKFTTGGGQLTVWEITLTPVVGGNATTTDVDPGAFPTG